MALYPYAQPIGALSQIITKLRSSFPETVDSGVLKKLAIAPNNESYIINTLRFLGIIDKEGKRTENGHNVFVSSDPTFGEGLGELVKSAYKGLFELHSDASWALDKSQLVSFFRSSDKSSGVVGGRQADTFIRIAEISSKRPQSSSGTPNGPNSASRESTKRGKPDQKLPTKTQRVDARQAGNVKDEHNESAAVSLAVRIEINLPATSDQAVYDAIFASIRSKLIDRA